MNNSKPPLWRPPVRPQWLDTMNREGSYLNLPAVVPLDEVSLIDLACRSCGLTDFGEEHWREPFTVLCKSLEEEGQLTLMGRLMARNDIIAWLVTRLSVTETLGRNPDILDEDIVAPMVIVGLPRSGTSILFELLAQDPEVGVPLTWEAMFPCPPPEQSSYDTDPRIQTAHQLATQWSRVEPEFATMHEMGGQIPAECGQLMVGSFISDQIAALHQIPSYSAYCAQADYAPVYEFHRTLLKILQWKNPRKRWLLKAPEHQVHLETLLQVYPDARLVQTHRDPIKCMASTTSLMGTLYHMRSDQPFKAEVFEDIIMGEATAARLEKVIEQREAGIVPAENIMDSRYQDLMDKPMACIDTIYGHFGMTLSDRARGAMEGYLKTKPQGKFGKHDYQVDQKSCSDRPLFRRYQDLYGVPDEV
jgi:hypothetical protein